MSVGSLGQLETRPMSTETDRCDPSTGRIGSIVVLPGSNKDGEFAIRVVSGITMSADDCVRNGYLGGCVVARRAMGFVPQETLYLPIRMEASCIDVPCNTTQTCRNGSCVSAKITNPDACTTPTGCDVTPPISSGGTSGIAIGSTGGTMNATGVGGGTGGNGTVATGRLSGAGGLGGIGGATGTGGAPANGGAPATGSGYASGGAAGSTSAQCPAVTPVAGNNPLIDDLEDGNSAILAIDGRSGTWSTNNDGTLSGTQNPPLGAFTATASGAHGSRYSARTWGGNFTSWGTALRVTLNATGQSQCAYDASRYTGIGFYAKGNQMVNLSVAILPTVPTAKGGTCATGCFDYHTKLITPTTSWAYYQIPWSQLMQGGWGTAASFSAASILYLEFEIGACPSFDLYIDDLGFY